MSVVKLPSGKTVKVPDGMTKEETIEFLFNNLDGKEGFEDDRAKLGTELETTGWGSVIGGTVGSIGGAFIGGVLTPFTGGVANPLTGGIAGGGIGAGVGENIEQWITGRGGDYDSLKAAGEGAAWGVVPGVGGQVTKGIAKTGGKAVPQILGSSAAGAATGAGISAATGVDPKIGAVAGALGGAGRAGGQAAKGEKGLLQHAIDFGFDEAEGLWKGGKKHLLGTKGKNVDKLWQDALWPAGKKYFGGWVKQRTGRSAAGGMQKAAAIWDAKRDVAAFFVNKATASAEKAGVKLSKFDVFKIRREAQKQASKLVDEYSEIRARVKANPNDKVAQAQLKDIMGENYGGQSYATKQDIFNPIDPATGERAFDPSITGYATGGDVGMMGKPLPNTNVRDRGRAQQAAIGDFLGKTFDRKQGIHPDVRGKVRGVAELVPLVGDVLAAEEIYREMNKPNPNWGLIGTLGGIALIGVIPGIGDAAAAAIKAGAKKAGRLAGDVKGVGKGMMDLDVDFLRGWGDPADTAAIGARPTAPRTVVIRTPDGGIAEQTGAEAIDAVVKATGKSKKTVQNVASRGGVVAADDGTMFTFKKPGENRPNEALFDLKDGRETTLGKVSGYDGTFADLMRDYDIAPSSIEGREVRRRLNRGEEWEGYRFSDVETKEDRVARVEREKPMHYEARRQRLWSNRFDKVDIPEELQDSFKKMWQTPVKGASGVKQQYNDWIDWFDKNQPGKIKDGPVGARRDEVRKVLERGYSVRKSLEDTAAEIKKLRASPDEMDQRWAEDLYNSLIPDDKLDIARLYGVRK